MEREDKLGKLLNVPPLLPAVKEDKGAELIETNPPETDYEQASGDFEVARDAMINALETSQGALETLSQVAAGSQHPRAFEVLIPRQLLVFSQRQRDFTQVLQLPGHSLRPPLS